MNKQCFNLLLFIGLLSLTGCTTNTIHLHTFEVDEAETQQIIAKLREKDFEVIVSERVPPLLQMGSFVIYPRDARDNKPLEQIFDVIGEYGYYTSLIAQNRVKNHVYENPNNIGLYLINPNIDWKKASEELKLGFAVELTDLSFTSSNCTTLYSLKFNEGDQGTIEELSTGFNNTDMDLATYSIQWQQKDNIVLANSNKQELRFTLEKDYEKRGNYTDLVLTLTPQTLASQKLIPPLSCKFESRTPLVD